MLQMSEIIKDKDFNNLDQEIQDNLTELLTKMNLIRGLWGQPMTVTSGLRTKDDQIRIYQQKLDANYDISKVPMGSQHLYGAAVDIYDPDKKLQEWCLVNVKQLEDTGLWCEAFSSTPNWVHFQIYSPKSGNRFFIP